VREQIRRVVTSHNEGGEAILLSDDTVRLAPLFGDEMQGAVIWTTGSVPADNVNDTQGDRRDPGASLRGGSVMRVTEFSPGFATPMHRTLSIDYAMVLSGEIELELDSGSVVRLRKGDVIVQRGSAHLWRNSSADTPCRIVICMIEAQPATAGTRTLKPTPTWKMLASLAAGKLRKSKKTRRLPQGSGRLCLSVS
jgi:quercetin dioxygenase-like cupin family protein